MLLRLKRTLKHKRDMDKLLSLEFPSEEVDTSCVFAHYSNHGGSDESSSKGSRREW